MPKVIPDTLNGSGSYHWLQLNNNSLSYKASILLSIFKRLVRSNRVIDIGLAELYSFQLKARHSPIPTKVAEIDAIPSWRDPILYFVAPCMMAFSCFRRLAIPV
jgi:hypothetical protein